MNTIDKNYYDGDNKIQLHLAATDECEQHKSINQEKFCAQRQANVKSTERKVHPDVNEKIKSFLSFSAQQNS